MIKQFKHKIEYLFLLKLRPVYVENLLNQIVIYIIHNKINIKIIDIPITLYFYVLLKKYCISFEIYVSEYKKILPTREILPIRDLPTIFLIFT